MQPAARTCAIQNGRGTRNTHGRAAGCRFSTSRQRAARQKQPNRPPLFASPPALLFFRSFPFFPVAGPAKTATAAPTTAPAAAAAAGAGCSSSHLAKSSNSTRSKFTDVPDPHQFYKNPPFPQNLHALSLFLSISSNNSNKHPIHHKPSRSLQPLQPAFANPIHLVFKPKKLHIFQNDFWRQVRRWKGQLWQDFSDVSSIPHLHFPFCQPLAKFSFSACPESQVQLDGR